MPGKMGIELPKVPIFAKASRLGFLAASSSVGPPGSSGRPPRPSATRSTILESFFIFSSRTNCWISMAGFLRSAGGERLNSPIDSENRPDGKWGCATKIWEPRDFLGRIFQEAVFRPGVWPRHFACEKRRQKMLKSVFAILGSILAKLEHISAKSPYRVQSRKVRLRWRLIPVVLLYLYAGAAAIMTLVCGLVLLVGTGYIAFAFTGVVKPDEKLVYMIPDAAVALPYATASALSLWLAVRCIWNQRYWRGTAFAVAGFAAYAIVVMIQMLAL